MLPEPWLCPHCGAYNQSVSVPRCVACGTEQPPAEQPWRCGPCDRLVPADAPCPACGRRLVTAQLVIQVDAGLKED